MGVLVILTADQVSAGAKVIVDDAVCSYTLQLGIGVFVVRRADDEAQAHALDKGAEHLARELEVVIHHAWSNGWTHDKTLRLTVRTVRWTTARTSVLKRM